MISSAAFQSVKVQQGFLLGDTFLVRLVGLLPLVKPINLWV